MIPPCGAAWPRSQIAQPKKSGGTEAHPSRPQLLAAKDVLSKEPDVETENTGSKANIDFATVERFNYNMSCLKAHDGGKSFCLTCDGTDVAGYHALGVALFNLDTGKASFGPIRVSVRTELSIYNLSSTDPDPTR